MKLWELDWTPGRKYKDPDGDIWKVDDTGKNLIHDEYTSSITEYVSHKVLATADFEPIINWSEVEVDTKLLVSNNGTQWDKRHFARFENNKILTFWTGCTSWTHPSGSSLTAWKYAKLAESEE